MLLFIEKREVSRNWNSQKVILEDVGFKLLLEGYLMNSLNIKAVWTRSRPHDSVGWSVVPCTEVLLVQVPVRAHP